MFSIVACLVAAAASSLRGGRYHAKDQAPDRRPYPHRRPRRAAAALAPAGEPEPAVQRQLA